LPFDFFGIAMDFNYAARLYQALKRIL
jgi:hypothetical protein